MDYIGGSGSRGYGKITFHHVTLCSVVGKIDAETLQKSKQYFTDFQKEV